MKDSQENLVADMERALTYLRPENDGSTAVFFVSRKAADAMGLDEGRYIKIVEYLRVGSENLQSGV